MKKWVFLAIRFFGTALAFFNLLMFFAMRPCWSGISSTLGYKGGSNQILYVLPVIICAFLLLLLLADLILKKIFQKGWLSILFLALHVVFLAAIFYIIANGAIDYMRFVWPKFFVGVIAVSALCLVYLVIFVYPKTFLKDNLIFKYGMLGLSGVLALVLLLHFSINRINYHPAVYAVEDKYQIVFSTSSESVSWAEVGGKKYYDCYSGSSKKFSKVHKIEVPMEALDHAKHYSIHSQRTIYAGPFGGFLGRELSEDVDFRPVNVEDGIQYLSFSDIHMNDRRAMETSSYFEKIDFLVLAGDIISDVETIDDANFTTLTAYEITKGQIPVIYARGNHDVKGRYAEELHQYVGAKGEDFYYTFYFQDIYGIVLDLGEDHDDDWWEYYGTAHYEDYQAKQIAFLEEEIAKGDFAHYPYHIAISHIPIPFVNSRHNQVEVKKQMTALLNQMDIDMYLCGHQHQLMIFEPGLVEPETELHYNSSFKKGTYKGYLTDFNFPSFMVSKPGFTYSDSTELSGAKSHIGFYVDADLATGKEVCHYRNSKGEKVKVMNMYAEKDYGDTITVDLNTKVFS